MVHVISLTGVYGQSVLHRNWTVFNKLKHYLSCLLLSFQGVPVLCHMTFRPIPLHSSDSTKRYITLFASFACTLITSVKNPSVPFAWSKSPSSPIWHSMLKIPATVWATMLYLTLAPMAKWEASNESNTSHPESFHLKRKRGVFACFRIWNKMNKMFCLTVIPM